MVSLIMDPLADWDFIVVPGYARWEMPYYGIGLKLYDLLARGQGVGDSRLLSREETLQRLPTLVATGLRGGALYYDAQFDDARLALSMAQTAADLGAALANYVRVSQGVHLVLPREFLPGETALMVPRTLEDFLARRSRSLLLDTRASIGAFRAAHLRTRCRPLAKPSRPSRMIYRGAWPRRHFLWSTSSGCGIR